MHRSSFNEELANIRTSLVAMASRVEEDLRKAVQALRERDEALALSVKESDSTVNAMQFSLQDTAAVLIATQQPVARDLRELVSAIRLADNLERMGDYAVHLARTAIKLKNAQWPVQFSLLGEMGERGCAMLRAMIDAYITQDVDAAIACAALDIEVDQMHHQLMALTMEELRTRTEQASEAIKIIRTSGFLERFADHVTNSCELVIYITQGRHTELNEKGN
ncbi:MAG: Phosphate-specific transport system accessory protein PhoU [Spirochaetes bacterium ADurb.Bin269]|jgi:phosphate transport system protein|nr:MAG: Phosphate-specific transport system accessory protein PhoU [Spirochaetes bacterium ADurb.Bin269]